MAEPVVTITDKLDHAKLCVYDIEGTRVVNKKLSATESLLFFQKLIPPLLHQLQHPKQGHWIPHHGYHP